MMTRNRLATSLVIALALSMHLSADEQSRMFQAWDRNQDGKLSRDELPEPLRANFNRVDADGNGFISLREHQQVRRRRGLMREELPPGTKVLTDLPYVIDGHERQKLDLYLPKSESPRPLVVWIHGGAWMAGSKDEGPFRPLLSRGFAVASINYRLSQHAQFPAQIHDCKTAIRWLRQHADEYQLDPERIGGWGSSAGGHLVALLGTSADVKDLDNDPDSQISCRVQAVCDWFGPTDVSKMNEQAGPNGQIDHDAPDAPEARLLGGPVQDHPDRVRLANPATWASADDPPFLIMHGDQDRVVPAGQSEILQRALIEQKVDSRLILVEGTGHGFPTPDSVNTVIEFFERTLAEKTR